MSTDEREAIDRLDAYLDSLAMGRSVPNDAVDPQWEVIERQLRALDRTPMPPPAFAGRLMEELMPTPSSASVLGGPTLPHANDQVRPPLRGVPPTLHPSVRRWVLTHLPTAALLLLIIVSGFFTFGPGRPGRQGQLPAVLPVMSGTPEAQEPVVTETLLQDTVSAMPAGAAGAWASAYFMQPGAISPNDGVVGTVVFTVAQGTVTITVGDAQRMLGAGDSWNVFTETGYVVENTGSDEAHLVIIEIIDTLASSMPANNNGPFIDEMSGTWEVWVQAATTLPGGPGQVTLQRLTLAPGAALPTYTEAGRDWLGIRAGRLTVRLEGERLPFRWKSGAERAFGRAQILPVFPAGSQVTLRNAGDDSLILYRLTITPGGGETAASATPEGGTPTS